MFKYEEKSHTFLESTSADSLGIDTIGLVCADLNGCHPLELNSSLQKG